MDWTFEWEKDVVTLNSVYSSANWRVRSNLKNKYHKHFEALISQYDKPENPIQSFGVKLLVNSRHDIDNLVIMNKWFVDTLREKEWVVEDNQKHFKKFVIEVEEDRPRNLYTIKLFEM